MRADKQFGIEIALDLGEEGFLQHLRKGFGGRVAVEPDVTGESSGQRVVLDQPVCFEHAAEDEAVEQLLAGLREIVEARVRIAEGEAVGDDEPPAFQVGEKPLVEIGFLALVVEFVDAVGDDIFEGQQFPEFLTAGDDVVEREREAGHFLVDADEKPLREIRQDDPVNRFFAAQFVGGVLR